MNIIKNTLSKLFLVTDPDGKRRVSLSKASATLGAVAGIVLAIGICPPAIVPIVQAVAAGSAGGVVVGLRDALK